MSGNVPLRVTAIREDVSPGPRRHRRLAQGGPAITRSDLLVMSRTGLAPCANASLDRTRGAGATGGEVHRPAAPREARDVTGFIERLGGLQPAVAAQ